MTVPADDRPRVQCPACAADVVVDPASIAMHCEQCGHDFFLDHQAEEEATATDEPVDHELDGLRIRQRMTMVRSAYRSRSYAVIAAVVCVVLVVQSVLSMVHRMRTGSLAMAGMYLLFALIGAWGTIYFFRKAASLHREAKRSSLDAPELAPDFSTLSDGSERIRNLEDIR
jgi:hypothetical protein